MMLTKLEKLLKDSETHQWKLEKPFTHNHLQKDNNKNNNNKKAKEKRKKEKTSERNDLDIIQIIRILINSCHAIFSHYIFIDSY